jgi:outer membrane immunogenic protein
MYNFVASSTSGDSSTARSIQARDRLVHTANLKCLKSKLSLAISWPSAVREVVLGSFVLSALVLAGSAMAADLPVKAPAAGALVRNWTGCYFGVNGGGASSGGDFTSGVNSGTYLSDPADLTTVRSNASGTANDSGFIGGGQVGCNFQTGTFVLGLDGDWDYFASAAAFTSTGTLISGDTFNITNSVKSNWLATVRPRLGISTDNTFLYVTGGAAFANFNYAQTYSDTAFAVGSSAVSRTVAGWTAGVGFETAWDSNWSIKVEYLFAKFASIGVVGGIASPAGGTNTLQGSVDLAVQVVRVGLNFKL